MGPSSPDMSNKPELSAERNLFEGSLQGMIAVCYVNERPLRGLVGLLDWRFQGVISRYLRNGWIQGKEGECAYVPVTRAGRPYHLILAGGGHVATSGERLPLSPESLQALARNLTALKLQQIGISRSDFGNVSEDYFRKNMKGVPLWIVP